MKQDNASKPVQHTELKSDRVWVTTRKFNRITVKRARVVAARWSSPEIELGETVELVADLERVRGGEQVCFRVLSGEAVLFETRSSASLSTPELRVPWQTGSVAARAIAEIGDADGPRPGSDREGLQKAAPDGGGPRLEVSLAGSRVVSEPLKIERSIELDFDAAETGSQLDGVDYLLIFADGQLRRGKLDEGGKLRQKSCPAGACSISLQGRHFPRPFVGQA